MTVDYAVTFEYMNLPPVTHRGVIAATKIGTCARMAIEEAQEAVSPKRWCSVLVLLYRRSDGESE